MDKLIARFTLEEQESIKAVFKMNVYPDKLSQLENDMNFVTKEDIDLPNLSTLVTEEELEKALETKQPKGDYASLDDIPDVSNFATKDEIPKMQLITQTDYDALATKDANTLYLIEE